MRHLMRGLAAVWLLSGVGSPAMAESVSVTSTFVAAGPQPAVPTCDATAGAGQGGYATPDNGMGYNWFAADSYCTSQGLRLPTKDELVALYNAYQNDSIASVCGWPTGNYYWSSTQNGSGSHYSVYLNNGGVYVYYDSNYGHVTCVR